MAINLNLLNWKNLKAFILNKKLRPHYLDGGYYFHFFEDGKRGRIWEIKCKENDSMNVRELIKKRWIWR